MGEKPHPESSGVLYDLPTLLVWSVTMAVKRTQKLRGIAEPERENAPAEIMEVEVPVINDRILHARNCTIAEYREEHYDECVDEPSSVYPRPEAGPDDIGFLAADSPVLLARLEN